MKRVTIQDVADRAEVSPTAVSFAFNKPDQLNSDTVARIRQVATELGYVPNPHARALISRRTGVIGVLVPQAIAAIFSNPFFDAFLQGVGSVCDEHDLSLLTISPINGGLERALGRAPADGFIIVGVNEEHHEVMPLRKRNMPFVIVDGDSDTASSVNVEDEIGAREAAAHVLAKGHRDILVISLEKPQRHLDDVYFGVRGWRVNGYKRAFAEHGVSWRDDRLMLSASTIQGGSHAFEQAWADGARPTAVLAMSDVMAIGVMRSAARMGIRVPQDLEIIGYDDIALAELVDPMLSTVHQPIVEKGVNAIQLLIAALDGVANPQRVRLNTKLVTRGTTR